MMNALRPVGTVSIQSLMGRVDGNKDGALSRSEFAAMEAGMTATSTGAAVGSSDAFDKYDVNKDGEISAAEFSVTPAGPTAAESGLALPAIIGSIDAVAAYLDKPGR